MSDALPTDLLQRLEQEPEQRLKQLLAALDEQQKSHRLDNYDPAGLHTGRVHHKQLEFHRLGAHKMLRMLAGGNRTGKTVAGCAEDAFHLTGRYPEWWEGRVFRHPVRWWVASDTHETTRDIDQEMLLGPIDNIGSGLIPRRDIISWTRKSGVTDGIDKVFVRNVYGGTSVLQFKAYEQGRKKFQGTSRHGVHLDEEPPMEILRECQQRVQDVDGVLYMTMTPLQGMTEACMLFYGDQLASSPLRARIDMSWADNPWLKPEVIAALEADMSPHELEARRDGRPQLGSGRIYPFSRAQIEVEPFDIPRNWPRGVGIDFGWNWTAACWLAYDEEGDTLYAYADYKMSHVSPAEHTSAIKARGDHPCFGDPSGWKQVGRQEDGKKIIELYEELPDPLDIRQADNAVQAGILVCHQRLSSGRLKIFSTCRKTLEEFDIYRRDDNGKVVKQNDHCMDALRYAVMEHGFFEVPVRRLGRGALLNTDGLHHQPASPYGY